MNKYHKKSSLRLIKCIGIIAISTSFHTLSEEHKMLKNCENSTTNEEISFCLDNIKTKAEKELVTWVNNQTFILEATKENTGRGAALKVFKRSMTKFKAYREDNCRWQYLNIAPEAGANIAYKQCYIDLTKIKINELSKFSQ